MATQMRAALARWVAAGWPARMAVAMAEGEDGTRWGLGLQVAFSGGGRFGQLLSKLPVGIGIHVIEAASDAAPPPPPPLDPDPGPPSDWWFHLGFTGPAVFYRPSDQACLVLLAHRRGPGGNLLDADILRARRWHLLAGWIARQVPGA
jgi:CubicO group peptidase (beta-lactamase class C family)